jgi:hypothetical protein
VGSFAEGLLVLRRSGGGGNQGLHGGLGSRAGGGGGGRLGSGSSGPSLVSVTPCAKKMGHVLSGSPRILCRF